MASFQPSTAVYAAVSNQNAPAGTFTPGTKVQVGSHRVVIEKYLSEGGFAHVYVVRLPAPQNAVAVLKRVAVADKEALANMRNEVETMKRLRGHEHIVTYIDSHASQLKGGGYEVFLLMEYCSGGGLIDFMNTRLKNRLTEPEILDIFGDAAEGVACMHYLRPPLLHRDLKVENILISKLPDGRKKFKLCDFGSAAPPRPAAKSAAEGRLIEDDVQKHTTLQYRSPEMIDVYRHKPIDEKSDVWALGVLLYKLCYYTTPFEEQGQMAILSANFKFPAYPSFSDKLKKLVAVMLMEDPQGRPNIYQIVKDVSHLRAKECPIHDAYCGRTPSEARSTQRLPARETNVKSPPMVGAKVESPEPQRQQLPEVKPMRRGRLAATSQSVAAGQSPAPDKPRRQDPFAALDSKNYDERAKAIDELSQKYPAVDDFSSLQSKGKFEFGDGAPEAPKKTTKKSEINKRVTDALADEAFAARPVTSTSSVRRSVLRQSTNPTPSNAKHFAIGPPDLHSLKQPQPQRPGMVSTGTMTSRPSSPAKTLPPRPQKASFEVWRVPQRSDDVSPRISSISRFDNLAARHSPLRDLSRSPLPEVLHSPSSSRPSLEGNRPTLDVVGELHRSRSTNAASETQHRRRGSGMFRRTSSKRESKQPSGIHGDLSTPPSPGVFEDTNIVSDMDYLRTIEAEHGAAFKSGHHRRSSSTMRNIKHASLPSLGGAKIKFAGRLGETFKRFESTRAPAPSGENIDTTSSTTTPLAAQADPDDELIDLDREERQGEISANEREANVIAVEDSPEQRRELERRQLEAEERRVEEAAAAYRTRVANGRLATYGASQPSARASAIQNRVRSLLDETSRDNPIKRTAEGYGRYTGNELDDKQSPESEEPPEDQVVFRNVSTMHGASKISASHSSYKGVSTSGASTGGSSRPVPPKPSVAPKPVSLRTGSNSSKPQLNTHITATDKVPPQNLMDESPDQPPSSTSTNKNFIGGSPSDWEANFARRYPRLSVELLDTEDTVTSATAVNEKAAKDVPLSTQRVKDI
ncbi:MAG: hypothetical protein Q9162_002604 [Coniocarpon cinnabarinum]